MSHYENRNFNLDILRAIGLFLIILAHCEAPHILAQLRAFDVPLMIVVSAATFAMLYKERALNVKSFYIKRTKQLILPAWYFLSFFFGSIFLGSYLLRTDFPFSLNEIIGSYTLYWGIGYVWILRIFLFIALLTPPLLYYKDKITNNYIYAGIAFSVYIAYEVLISQLYRFSPDGNTLFFVKEVILPIIPYACLYLYGLKLDELSSKFLIISGLICGLIFAGLAVHYYQENGEITGTFDYKFPPRLYFLSFSIAGVNATYLIIKYFYPGKFLRPFWTWISVNSLWIYLWHIYGIFIWSLFYIQPDRIFSISISKYLFVTVFAILITRTQQLIIDSIKNRA